MGRIFRQNRLALLDNTDPDLDYFADNEEEEEEDQADNERVTNNTPR